MTRVDFYVVKSAGSDARLSVAARLTEKALGRGHKIFINCESETQLLALNTLLWDFKPSSFIPHALAAEDENEHVVLGFNQVPNTHNDVLINLALAPPRYFARFERVAEGVTQVPKHLGGVREEGRNDRDKGYPLSKQERP